MGVGCRDDDVLGEAAVGFAAQQPHRRRLGVVVEVDRRVDQHPPAHQPGRYAGADRGDHTGDVTALHEREGDRATPPSKSIGLARQPVGALASPDVGCC